MFGLGRERTKFGRWCEKNGIKQKELVEHCKLSDGTISKMYKEKDYKPKYSTLSKLEKGLKKLGHNTDITKFW